MSIHLVDYVCLYKAVQLKCNSNTLEPNRPQHDRLAACVIAKQYSSDTVGSLRFHFHKGKKFAARLKIVVSLVFKNFIPLKWCNLLLRKLGSVCIRFFSLNIAVLFLVKPYILVDR